ncbi:MAG: CBS domain-containing protein [Saccharospirillaceae bacterium]|nr:CBS domain-containing protein [Pseudomonadales bacterium]NRB80304.1 CBS domain-containing protein [Saccharospirillaceae bacterium]
MSEDRSIKSENWFTRIGKKFSDAPSNKEELMEVLERSKDANIINEDALGIIEGALEVQDTHVREIMTPRAQMYCLDLSDDFGSISKELIDSSHSRYPVLSESGEDIIGVLMAKDLLNAALQNNFDFEKIQTNLPGLVRNVLFIPESKRLNILLKEFRQKRMHMAIVLDEYGSFSGLVTIEDILEEIVGEIEDEHDEVEEDNIQKKDNHFLVNALTPIDEFNAFFECQFESDEYETIAGIVTHQFGHLPKRGESIDVEDFSFKIKHSDERRIKILQVTSKTTTNA